MADSECDGFEPNKYRPTVCAKCFRQKKLHDGGGNTDKSSAATGTRQASTASGISTSSTSDLSAKSGGSRPTPGMPRPNEPSPSRPAPSPPTRSAGLSKSTSQSSMDPACTQGGTGGGNTGAAAMLNLSSSRKRKPKSPTPGSGIGSGLGSGTRQHRGTDNLAKPIEKMKGWRTTLRNKITTRDGGDDDEEMHIEKKGSGIVSKDDKRWSRPAADWCVFENMGSSGSISCLKLQDDVMTLMNRTGFISDRTFKQIWDIVTSDGGTKKLGTGQQWDKSSIFDDESIQRLTSIVNVSSKLLDVQLTLRKVVRIQCVVRGFLARRRVKRLRELYCKEPLLQRNIHFREMLKKEQNYNFDLDVIVRQFLYPARELAKGHFRKTIPSQDIQAIFANIEEIQAVHNAVYIQLKIVQDQWPEVDGVGQVFLSNIELFKCYGKYVYNFKNAIETLNNCVEKYENFALLIREKSEQCDMELQGIISAPLNQMSTYELMLERILDCTPARLMPEEAIDLEQCLSAIRQTNKFILLELENAENQAKILNVERRIARKAKLEKRGRLFVDQEGIELYDRATPNKRYSGEIVLFSDQVLIAKQGRGGKGLGLKALISLENTGIGTPEDLRKVNGFEISGDGTSWAVIFTSAGTMRVWLGLMKDYISKNQKNRVFEVSLVQVLSNEGNPDPPIPSIVRKVIAYLDDKALKTEGLFRVAGSRKAMDELRAQVDKGVDINPYEADGVHTVASLLKLYFRCLPEPLLTFAAYDPLMKAFDAYESNSDREKFAAAAKSTIGKIPKENRILCRYLLAFLARVAKNSEVNMMQPSNLAICFAPNLLQPREQTISSALDVMKVNGIVEVLIEQNDIISDQ